METARSDRFRERAGTASERGNSKREADDQIEPASDIFASGQIFLFSKSAFLILFRRKFVAAAKINLDSCLRNKAIRSYYGAKNSRLEGLF